MNSFLMALLAVLALGQSSDSSAAFEQETVDRLQAYLQVDTVNPPGNESRAVDLFANLLDAEGIPYETAESAPSRGNLWARLEGGPEPDGCHSERAYLTRIKCNERRKVSRRSCGPHRST